MSSTFSFLVCILAFLIGILIGEKYRKWKKARDKGGIKDAGITRTEKSGSDSRDSETDTQ